MFPIYSIAKTFLAQCVLELGFQLDEPIGNYAKAIPNAFADRTIESLLNHTSGISDYSDLTEYHQAVERREPAWSREELFKNTQSLNHRRQGFHYSNIGYLLLRIAVEEQTGSSMFQAIEKFVLQPLAIEGFSEWENESDLVPNYDPKWVYSGTFLATRESVIAGYLKVIQRRDQQGLLGTGMTAVNFPDSGFENPHYGFGVMCDVSTSTGKPQLVGHGGGGPVFAHMILVNTQNWRTEIETSRGELNQRDAILRLREAIAD